MTNRITIRIDESLSIQLARVAAKAGLAKSEVARVFLQKALTDEHVKPAETAPEIDPEIVAAMAAEVLELRADSGAIREAVSGIQVTMRDLAIAVQKLYQPPAQTHRQPPPVHLEKRQNPPPSFPAWAGDKHWLEGEDKAGRVHRLAAEYKKEFGIWPANYTPPAGA